MTIANEQVGSPLMQGGWEGFRAILLSLLILCVVAAISIMAAVPPHMRDELIHHLAVPKLWLAQGGIHEIPHMIFSYYPMNLDLLYMLPLFYSNDIVPKYIHCMFGLGTAWLIYAFLRDRTERWLALVGVLMFLSTPVVLKLSISAYVDLGLIFFTWASMVLLMQWAADPAHVGRLYGAAALCGLGLGTKYNGLIVWLILSALIPFVYLRSHRRSICDQLVAVRHALLFGLIALLLFAPWMVKNYRWTGNPLYPLYNDVFNDGNAGMRFTLKPLLQRKLIYGESPLATAAIPVRVFFEGQDDDPKYFDGRLNPFLLLLPVMSMCWRPRDRQRRVEQRLLGSFACIFLLMVFFTTDMRIRYIAPILPPLIVLAVYGLNGLVDQAEKSRRRSTGIFLRTVVGASIVAMLTLNAFYLVNLFRDVDPLPLLTGKVSREHYLEGKLPDYAVIRKANAIHREGNKLLGLFAGRRRYYFRSEIVFMMDELADIVDRSASGQTMVEMLTKDGFTHLFVGIQAFERWVATRFDERMKADIRTLFVDHLELIDEKNGYALFAIKQG